MMADQIRVALCQINTTVGDFIGNSTKIVDAYRQAVDAGARLAVFPELVVCGFPAKDLLLRNDFIAATQDALNSLVDSLDGPCAAVIGAPTVDPASGALLNSGVVVREGEIQAVASKGVLSHDGPLDEHRYFGIGRPALVDIEGIRVAVVVGDDALDEAVVEHLVSMNPQLVLNPVAQPYKFDPPRRGPASGADGSSLGPSDVEEGERAHSERIPASRSLSQVADLLAAPVVVVNNVGANDEVIMVGGSSIFVPEKERIHRSVRFRESIEIVNIAVADVAAADIAAADDATVDASAAIEAETIEAAVAVAAETDDPIDDLWAALVLGISDYVDKNGFASVGLGLSGGVDSALVAALAVDALGADRVHCVLMPSRYSSSGSLDDAMLLAANLRVDSRIIRIEAAHRAFEEMLAESFAGLEEDLTEENIQARVRGTTLMALSNKFGWLILVTGNRSEVAVGYSTLYGDSAGGLAPISGIDKLTVYSLCRWYNERCSRTGSESVIPEVILRKAPSAELRPGQRDDQSLPPYEILDPLLSGYLDAGLSRAELVAAGIDRALVDRVTQLVDRAEYKRRQSPPGLAVAGRDALLQSQMPITRRILPT